MGGATLARGDVEDFAAVEGPVGGPAVPPPSFWHKSNRLPDSARRGSFALDAISLYVGVPTHNALHITRFHRATDVAHPRLVREGSSRAAPAFAKPVHLCPWTLST